MATRRRGRGEGGIYQRASDGRWVSSVELHKHGIARRRKVVYGRTKSEVQKKLLNLQQRYEAGTLGRDGRLSELLGVWLGTVRLKVDDSTYDRYKITVTSHLVPLVGNVQLAKLSALTVTRLYAELAERGVSASDRQKAGKALRQALRHGITLGLVTANVATQVPLPRVKRREIHPFSPELTSTFLGAILGHRYEPLFRLALDTGMRQGEIFALERTDVDLERGYVTVNKSLSEVRGNLKIKTTKTKAGRRQIRLSDSTVTSLRGHLVKVTNANNTTLLFPSRQGHFLRKSNFNRRHWQKVMKKAGFTGFTFHDLRHTCATLLMLAGVHVKVVSERLGHARIETTLNIYSHVIPAMQDTAATAIGKFLV